MAKRKVKVLTPEEQRKIEINSALNDIQRMIAVGTMAQNPTRTFKVNERVIWGGHNETYVREVHENGLYYTIENIIWDKEGQPTGQTKWTVLPWLTLNKYKIKRDTSFAVEDRYYVRQHNSGLDSLIHIVYSEWAGVDFDVEYQREHVWELSDKIALIDSIFNNIDIGKFVFAERHEKTQGKYYEVIDGKQRLTAICEFYEDRFKYRGKYFSQLSNRDRYKILNKNVSYGYLENPTKEAIYATFIKMNTCGRPMDSKHIDKVKKLLTNLK